MFHIWSELFGVTQSEINWRFLLMADAARKRGVDEFFRAFREAGNEVQPSESEIAHDS